MQKIFLISFLLYVGNFRELVDYLNESTELLQRNLNLLDNVLETLDLQNHSLGVMYIVAAKISEIQVSKMIKLWRIYADLFTFLYRMKIQNLY